VIAFVRRFERVIRYVLVGGGVTLFYTLVTATLISGKIIADPTLASAIASVVTLPISFLVHRRFTYADTKREQGQWERFALIAVANFVVNVGAMKAADAMHFPYWSALAFGWVVVPVVNYAINVLWVFRSKTFLSLGRRGEQP
jgi:putative flippase GtrA